MRCEFQTPGIVSMNDSRDLSIVSRSILVVTACPALSNGIDGSNVGTWGDSTARGWILDVCVLRVIYRGRTLTEFVRTFGPACPETGNGLCTNAVSMIARREGGSGINIFRDWMPVKSSQFTTVYLLCYIDLVLLGRFQI